jgi:hypothetical protein
MKMYTRLFFVASLALCLLSCSHDSIQTDSGENPASDSLNVRFPITLMEMGDERFPLLKCFHIANTFFIYNGTFDGTLTMTSTQCRIIASQDELDDFLDDVSYPGDRAEFRTHLKAGRILGFVNEGDQAYLLFFDRNDRMCDFWPRTTGGESP